MNSDNKWQPAHDATLTFLASPRSRGTNWRTSIREWLSDCGRKRLENEAGIRYENHFSYSGVEISQFALFLPNHVQLNSTISFIVNSQFSVLGWSNRSGWNVSAWEGKWRKQKKKAKLINNEEFIAGHVCNCCSAIKECQSARKRQQEFDSGRVWRCFWVLWGCRELVGRANWSEKKLKGFS